MGQVVRGNGFRSRLLIGVAAVAVATPAAGKAFAQEAKWQPWLEAGGMVGTNSSFGDVDMFIPVWQDQTSMLFGDLRGKFSSQSTQEGNFGLGYRTQVDPEWILGGYGYFDIQNSPNDNLFYQATLGLEALSVDWDFRVNGYIPFNSSGQNTNSGGGDLQISGNKIGITTSDKEKSLYGFDGEVGWRLPIFPADGDVDVRAFVGGYYFANSDVNTVAGPRGRLEVRLYDLDLLGVQSRLTVDGEVQWDDPRGTQAFGGLELRIPLGAVTGTPGPKLSPLDRRMVDRVQRDVDIVTRKYGGDTQDVVVDEMTVKTHTIVFATANGDPNAKGTKNDPTDLQSAVDRYPGKNAIIVVEGDNGALSSGTDFSSNGLQLHPGEALLGGGSRVPLHAANGHYTVNFNVPGDRPTLVGTSPVGALIQMAFYGDSNGHQQNEIFGLNLDGQMEDGIFGLNMERAIVKQTYIDPPLANGIEIVQDGPGAPLSSFVHIEDNTVVGAGFDGILVASDVYDGLARTQAVIIDGNVVNSNRHDGIEVVNEVNQTTDGVEGTTLSQFVAIAYNIANHNGVDAEGGIGINVGNFAGAGGAISQGLVIIGNTASYNSFAPLLGKAPFFVGPSNGLGILVENEAAEGGVIGQYAAIVRNNVISNSQAGILALNEVSEDGQIDQQLAVYHNFVSGNGDGLSHGPRDGIGIGVDNFATEASTISQALFVDGNTVVENESNGVAVRNFADYNSGISQSGEMLSNVVSHNGENGIYLLNQVGEFNGGGSLGAAVTQSLSIAGNSIDHNGEDGVRVQNNVFSQSVLSQALDINDNTVVLNEGDGIHVYSHVESGGLVSQSIFIDPNTILQNDGNGVLIGAYVSGATLSQTITIVNNSIIENDRNGIDIFVRGEDGADISQSVSVAGNTILSSGEDGVLVESRIYGETTQSQVANIVGNSIDNSNEDGIDVRLRAVGDATAVQSATIQANTVTNSDNSGIQVGAYASLGAAVTQTLNITGNAVDRVLGEDGIRVGGRAWESGTLTQTVSITANSVGDTGEDGIYVFTDVSRAAGTQSLIVDGNTVTDAGEDGIRVFNGVRSGTLTQTSLDISFNTIVGADANGITLVDRVHREGVLVQASSGAPATIYGNVIGDIGNNGIFVSNRANHDGELTQALAINANNISDAQAGIYISTAVLNGASAHQLIAISGNAMNDVSYGVFIQNRVWNGGDATQGLTIANNVIDEEGKLHNNGIDVHNEAFNGGYLTQGVAIQSNTLANAVFHATAGIALYNDAFNGGGISQSALIDSNSVAAGFEAGIGLEDTASHGGDIGQNITITNNNVGAAFYAGIGMLMEAGERGHISQGGTIANNIVAGQTGTAGAGLVSFVYSEHFGTSGSTFATQTLQVTGNIFSNNSNNGIYLKANAADGSSTLQDFSLSGNVIDNNGNDGLKAIANDTGTVQTVHFVSAGNNSITNNGNFGVYASSGGGATQSVNLSSAAGGVIFSGNTSNFGGNVTP